MDHNKIFAHAVMSRTYCRDVGGKKETLTEPFQRVLNSFEKYYRDHIDRVEWFEENPNWKNEWYNRMVTGKALPAGRMLWAMGSRTIEEEGFLPLMNCGFVVIDDPIEPLLFIMRMLMLGCGMGFSLENKHFIKVYKKMEKMRNEEMEDYMTPPEIQNKPGGWIVEDSRTGWIELLRKVLTAGILRKPFYYSLENLRPAGTPIKGFGGVSGDPKMLETTMNKIYQILVMYRSEYHPDMTAYYDIICLIGQVVVSGNVRRSALIAIGDSWDLNFLELKNFKSLSLYPWRCFCNNSVNASKFKDLNGHFWKTFNGQSEAYGIVNMKKCRKEHRKRNYDRDSFEPLGFNPCGEQPLANYELCCLGEVNMSRCETYNDFFQSLVMCYFFCKFSYTLGCPVEKVQEVSQLNQRIGISLTSLCMSDDNQIREWATRGRQWLRVFDQQISQRLGLSRSVALTTIKPGGTLTKISGSAGPGIHRPISEYQIRRVRFHKSSPLLPWLEKSGVPIEPQRMFDGTLDPSGTQIASFYIRNGVPADGHFSDWLVTPEGFADMLGRVALLQDIWSDNSISVTVYYPIDKLDDFVKRGVKRVFKKVKTLSLLPYSGHNFPQAPEEPISEEDFKKFFEEHPYIDHEPTNHVPEHEAPEDFGLCEGKSQCSDRG